MALHWGIASAGKISNDFVNALGVLPDSDHKVVAVAARDLNRAKEFAQVHGIPKWYGSYDELAKNPDVECVYIGVLNPQHYEVALLMLENNKHVLCEKPLCMNEKQSRKLIQYAERRKLFLMEAVWSRFFPVYQYLRKQIKSGILGDVQELTASFGFKLDEVERLCKKDLGGGTVLDLGVYTIQLAQWVFEEEPPKSIKATGTLNDEGVDLETTAELYYSGNRIARLSTSALREYENRAIIKGTKGEISFKSFWCPTTLIDIDGTEKTWPLPKTKNPFSFSNSVGLSYEAEEVQKCIRLGLIESPQISHNHSLIIANIEDEIRRQIGVVYEADK